jgi:hypothetical protein
VRTGWLIAPNSKQARLATIYIPKKSWLNQNYSTS